MFSIFVHIPWWLFVIVTMSFIIIGFPLKYALNLLDKTIKCHVFLVFVLAYSLLCLLL